MAAISLGVGEIEERLETVRRRLNLAALLRMGCTALALVCFLLALIVATGSHHSLSSRSMLAIVLTAVSVAAGVTAYLLRRAWLDLGAAAQVADQRARLAERLTTLVSMRRKMSSARLMPVLVAQLVSAMPCWQPQLVAPFQVPASAYAGAAALLSLLLAFWMAPPAPAPQPMPVAVAAAPPLVPPVEVDWARQAEPGGGLDAAVQDRQPRADETSADDHRQATGAAGDRPGDPLASESAGAPSQQEDEPAAGDAPPGSSGAPVDRAASREAGDAVPQRRTDAVQQEGGSPAGEQPVGSIAAGRSQADNDAGRADRNPPNQPAPPEKGGRSEAQSAEVSPPGLQSSRDGQAPRSGAGSTGAPLMGADGASMVGASESAPRTFPLTITSFLQATEARRPPAKRGKRGGGATASGPGSASPELHRQQQHDDALRKTEIPVELEEIVRRVYSARPQP